MKSNLFEISKKISSNLWEKKEGENYEKKQMLHIINESYSFYILRNVENVPCLFS